MKDNTKSYLFDITTNVLGVFSIWAGKPSSFLGTEDLATVVGKLVFIIIGINLINLIKYEKIVAISRYLSKEEK